MNVIEETVMRLKEIRIMRGITQKELAETLGVDQGNLSKMESVRFEPRLSTLIAWAAALGQDVKILLLSSE